MFQNICQTTVMVLNRYRLKTFSSIAGICTSSASASLSVDRFRYSHNPLVCLVICPIAHYNPPYHPVSLIGIINSHPRHERWFLCIPATTGILSTSRIRVVINRIFFMSASFSLSVSTYFSRFIYRYDDQVARQATYIIYCKPYTVRRAL